MKKISTKLVMAIMLCVVISVAVIGSISANSAEEALSEQVNRNMQALSTQYAYEMETSFAYYEGIAKTIGTYVGATYDRSKAKNIPMSSGYFLELGKYIQAVSTENQGLVSVATFVNPNLSKVFFGAWFSGEEEIIYDHYDAYKEFSKDDPKWYWHKTVVDKMMPLWSDPYYSDQFDVDCISYYYPIIDEAEDEDNAADVEKAQDTEKEEDIVIAFVVVDVPFASIKEIASNISSKEVDGVMLLDSYNRIVVDDTHTEGTLLSEAGYAELEQALLKNTNGNMSMSIDGEKSFVGYERLKNDFTVVVHNRESKVFAPINKTNLVITLVSVVAIIISMLLAIIVGKSITHPIYYVIEDLLLMENGDFTGTKHKKCLANQDETGKLAKALEVIQVSMRDMVNVVNDNSNFVTEMVKKLDDIVEQLINRAISVRQVAEDLSAGMEETSATAESLSDTSSNLKMYMEQMKEKNEEGSSSIRGIAHKAIEINKEFSADAIVAEEKTQNVMSNLQYAIEEAKKVEQIEVLTESILAIADETNLLALNTSIEAARFGSQGRGFSVIAQEISRLAEQSQKTAERIRRIVMEVIGAVQKLSQSSEGALDFMNDYIVNGYTKLIEVSEQYSNDSANMKYLFDGYTAISNDVVRETQLLTAAFHELKDATIDGTIGTQNLVSNADQMSAITENVQRQSQLLKEVFAKLTEAIGRFSV